MRMLARSGADPRVVFAAAETPGSPPTAASTWAPYGHRITQSHAERLVVGAGPVDNLLLAASGQLFRSRAGGGWEQAHPAGSPGPEPPPVQVSSLEVSPADPSLVVAAIGSGTGTCSTILITISTDGGGTWRPAHDAGTRCSKREDPAEVQLVMSLTDRRSFWVLERTSPSRLWHTADAGGHWVRQPGPPADVTQIDLAPPGTDLVGRGPFSTYHRALAGGSWTAGVGACATAVLPEIFLPPIANVATGLMGCRGTVGPGAPAIAQRTGAQPLLLAAFGGISRQSGTTWETSMAGLRAQLPIGVIRLADRSVVLATQLGIYREDPVDTWTPWSDGLPAGELRRHLE